MLSLRFRNLLTRGVGRRILTFFLLAGIVPVIITAYLAYAEIVRGMERDTQRKLREYARNYGMQVVDRLTTAGNTVREVIDVLEKQGAEELANIDFLLGDFEFIGIVADSGETELAYGARAVVLDPGRIDFEHLAAGDSQLLHVDSSGRDQYVILRAAGDPSRSGTFYAFGMSADTVWYPGDSRPYLTEFCAFAGDGVRIYCTAPMDAEIHRALANKRGARDNSLTEWRIAGDDHFIASWQLFLPGILRFPPVDIITSQPQTYALRSNADFRRIFPPAIVLGIILVILLSVRLIGDSLGPLHRLMAVTHRFAAGKLDARVRIRTGDEFESLADAFNDMASRLGLQISALRSMSKIDRFILEGVDFDGVCEEVVRQTAILTGAQFAAVIALSTQSSSRATMIYCSGEQIHHDRVRFPDDADRRWGEGMVLSAASHLPEPIGGLFDRFHVENLLSLPILVSDEVKGIVLIGSHGELALSTATRQLCNDMAGRLAVALSSAEREDALYRQAHFDELTGLPNRQLLKDRLEQHLVQARSESFEGVLLYLDLDRFKEINDVYGHSVGDEVLKVAAERIVAETRESDTVSRQGGDEFVVLMPHVANHNLLRVFATRLLARLAEPFHVQQDTHFLSASIGIVIFPTDGDNVESLLKNADAAMYRAKDAGRSRFEFFSESLNVESRRKIRIEKDLRRSLQDDQLQVHYQPQFDLHTGVISGAEVLARWPHPELGQIPPIEFVQIAEDCGLIIELGHWVLDRACADLRHILDLGFHPGSLAINISARQLRDAAFLSDVFHTLRRHNIPPSYVELEITESTIAHNRDIVTTILESFRRAGVRIAMDDFGTGYSSLSYLQDLPFDVIKIDKTFIDAIGVDFSAERICRTIIKMADELGKQTVAEGVENRSQAEFLLANGCGKVQGYYFSKPLPQAEFLSFIEKQDFHTQRRKALEIVS